MLPLLLLLLPCLLLLLSSTQQQNCPVCCEFLFDSIRPISVLTCGHTIHQVSALLLQLQKMVACGSLFRHHMVHVCLDVFERLIPTHCVRLYYVCCSSMCLPQNLRLPVLCVGPYNTCLCADIDLACRRSATAR
jgi:hypothetical protein